MDEASSDRAGRPDAEPASDASGPDLGTLILAGYFVALILVVIALLVLPAIF